jgi:oligosaccharide repeat unit polymerase
MKPVLRAMLAATLLFAAAGVSAFVGLGAGVVVGALAFVVAVALPAGTSPGRIISLEAFALLGLAGYSLPVPIHQLVYEDYPPDAVQYAFELCLLAGAGMVLGNLLHALRSHAAAAASAPPPTPRDWSRYYWVGWIVFAFGVASALLAVGLTVGFNAYVNAGYAGRSLLKRGAGPIELGLYHAVLGLVFVNLARILSPELRRRRRLAVAMLLISIIFVAYVSFLGIRRPSFFLVLSMVLVYAAAGRGLSRAQLAMTVAPGLVLFAMFASFRQVLSDQGTSAAWNFVRNNFSLRWFDLSNSELGAPFRVLIDVLTTWNADPPRLGVTFAEVLPYALPRAAGLGVTSLSQEYTVRNFSTDFIAIGGNMGFNPVAEGYVNFGPAGVVLYFVLIGWFVSRIQHRVVHRRAPLDLVAYALAGPWFIFFIRLDLASFFKVYLYSVVVPYVLAVGLLYVWRRTRTPSRRGPAPWTLPRPAETG